MTVVEFAGDKGVEMIGHYAVRNYFKPKRARNDQELRGNLSPKVHVFEDWRTPVDANRQEISIEADIGELGKTRWSVSHTVNGCNRTTTAQAGLKTRLYERAVPAQAGLKTRLYDRAWRSWPVACTTRCHAHPRFE